jgi:hypothetical protein
MDNIIELFGIRNLETLNNISISRIYELLTHIRPGFDSHRRDLDIIIDV